MGMFDDVKFKMKCPKCKTKMDNFQSKDGDCAMFLLEFWEVNNFYDSCHNCNTWVEFFLKKKMNKKRTIQDYERVVKISTDEEEKAHRKKYNDFAEMLKIGKFALNKENGQ